MNSLSKGFKFLLCSYKREKKFLQGGVIKSPLRLAKKGHFFGKYYLYYKQSQEMESGRLKFDLFSYKMNFQNFFFLKGQLLSDPYV